MTDSQKSQQAIDAALLHNWEMAISLNEDILRDNPNDLDTLNRLGFAFLKSGNIKKAKLTFQQVKTIDPYNQIALRNLSKIELMKDGTAPDCGNGTAISPLEFLEDPGKTKIALCVNIAPSNILSIVTSGQEVYLKPKNHCIEIRDYEQRYLGALPDDLSFKLLKLLEGKNAYRVFVKNVGKNMLSVIVREISRGKKFSNQPSFINTVPIQPLGHDLPGDQDRPDTSVTGEDDETEQNAGDRE